MFCPKCGKNVPGEAVFCGECGADLRPFRKEASPARPAPAPKVRMAFPLKKLLIAVLCLTLLAAGGFALYQWLGMETVYLVTREVTQNTSQKQTIKREYDTYGRPLVIETTTRYTGSTTTSSTVTYRYDDDGRLIAVELETDGDTYELEYVYDDNGHLKRIECGAEEAEVECDREGRIIEIVWESGSVEYSYHKNGGLKEIDRDYGYTASNFTYDEAGNLTEAVTWANGEKRSATETIFDADGNQTQMTMRTYSDGKVVSDIVVDYVYDDMGLVSQLTLTVSAESGDSGEEMHVTLSLEADGNGLEREFNLADMQVEGDLPEGYDALDADEAMKEMKKILEEQLDGAPFMYFEYDEYGNMLESSVGPAGISDSSREYTALRLPKGYREPVANEPVYFIPPFFG